MSAQNLGHHVPDTTWDPEAKVPGLSSTHLSWAPGHSGCQTDLRLYLRCCDTPALIYNN